MSSADKGPGASTRNPVAAGAPGALAVFCDYDGTFAVQDVGASIARKYAPAQRPVQWARYERGELTPWGYNMEIFDGLRLPETELDAFLRTVELMPGARELLAWCEAAGVPFRILSDGFDYNLERLQQYHDVRFSYQANRLRYEAGAWRLSPGAPDASCFCGTGVCKAGCIRAFRKENPGLRVVYIGNGRVSDLCASGVSDLVFAKDTLAQELRRQQRPFEPFADLFDVLSVVRTCHPE